MLLITGSNGQLGTELVKLLPDALAVDVDVLDITDKEAVDKFVKDNDVNTIINCAAYTAVDKAEDEPELAEKINLEGPLNLARSVAKIVHISTDYVFDGKGYKPYTEEDAPSPVSVYGKTKYAAEKAVMDNAKAAFIFRTAWLYSPYGHNFVKTMRSLGAERETLNVVVDQVGTPTYALDLAQAIIRSLPSLQEGEKELYHYSNEGVCSWYDFACEIMALSGLKCKVNPIPSKDYPTKAVRPFYSVLDKSKIRRDFGVEIPYWKESLEKCLAQL